MIGALFQDIAAKNGLTTASGLAYGMLGGCFVTLSEEADNLRISIYVGPQEQPAPGYQESATVSCARQICHAISTASGPDNLYALMTGSETIPALVLNHAGSVVTVNFSAAPEAAPGVTRFVTELLPQIAPLTRPQSCIFCCGDTHGDAVPVRLSADTVVPMHVPCYRQAAGVHAPTREERAAQNRAILGAGCGALIGAVLWGLLSGFGPVAWIVAVLMGLLPTLAYDLLKGKEGRARIITVAACAACAVLLGSLGAAMLDLHAAYQLNLTAFTAENVGFAAYVPAGLTADPAIRASLLKALIAGAIFAAIGCLGHLRKTGDPAAATAEADKPRRLRGSF